MDRFGYGSTMSYIGPASDAVAISAFKSPQESYAAIMKSVRDAANMSWRFLESARGKVSDEFLSWMRDGVYLPVNHPEMALMPNVVVPDAVPTDLTQRLAVSEAANEALQTALTASEEKCAGLEEKCAGLEVHVAALTAMLVPKPAEGKGEPAIPRKRGRGGG